MSDLQNLANLIGCIVYLFSNGEMAAQNSTLAKELFESGLSVVKVAKPNR